MKKTIIRISMMFVMMVATATATYAQQVTKEQIKELMKTGSIDFKSQQESTRQSLVQQTAGMGNVTAQKVNDYLEGAFFDDLVECSYPYYSKHLTVKDYEYLKSKYNSEAGKTAYRHSTEASAALTNSLNSFFAQDLASKLPLILQGQKVEARQITCSAAYKAKWDKYYASIGLEKMIGLIFEKIKEGLGADVPKENKAQFDTIMANLTDYFMNDVFVCLCNASEGTLTEADLDFSIEINESEAGIHLKEAGLDIAANAMQLSQQLETLCKKHFEK